MNTSTQVEAGPSRTHNHISIPPTRRLSNSTQTQPQSRSSSNRRPSSAAPHETTSTSTSHPPSNSSSTANNQPHSNSSPQNSKSYHLDIANYPTQQLLRLLAGLLQHIATSNDALRTDPDHPDQDEDGEEGGTETLKQDTEQNNGIQPTPRSRSHSRTSSQASFSQQHSSSPTTALFDSSHPTDPPSTPDISQQATSGDDYPLFTASKSSLSHPSSLLAFHARHIPSISIEAYLLRILKYCPTTNEVFLGLLVYFDRMTRLGTPLGVGGPNVLYNHGSGTNGKQGNANKKNFAIDSYNVHRLVIAGVTVASKFFSDVFYTNSRYAKVGGLPPTELNSLELQFLLLNDFRLRISLDEMQKYGDRLLAYAEEQEEGLEVERERGRMERSGLGDGVQQNIPPSTSTSTGTSEQQQQQRNQDQDTSKIADGPTSDQTDKGKEKDVSFGNTATSTEVDGNVQPQSQPQAATQPQHVVGNTSTASGIKDWVRGEEVMGGRMASPMRD
ncbi:hypothetical protein I302_101922 [Kwoniella bestiolae CBS 10118]|uniref:Glycogen storage control protein n=1 Tax=Kwoniella bestiolae CBS 10118 TaxID=1296100 RepID=A0A1B9GDM0_9TREE|nr:hypothetical protein I302_00604 [Kwoniella bestiolae CBS 10118]OCF29110.1 hypothetical protein I302_00604 [Kwoniella bestiolae CBS 10118]